MTKIILKTKRLDIVTPTLDSLDNWFKLQSDPEVMRYIGDGKKRDRKKDFGMFARLNQ